MRCRIRRRSAKVTNIGEPIGDSAYYVNTPRFGCSGSVLFESISWCAFYKVDSRFLLQERFTLASLQGQDKQEVYTMIAPSPLLSGLPTVVLDMTTDFTPLFVGLVVGLGFCVLAFAIAIGIYDNWWSQRRARGGRVSRAVARFAGAAGRRPVNSVRFPVPPTQRGGALRTTGLPFLDSDC